MERVSQREYSAISGDCGVFIGIERLWERGRDEKECRGVIGGFYVVFFFCVAHFC